MINRDKPLIFDTHAWFWLATGSNEIIKNSEMKQLINSLHDYKLIISSISHWEISMLETKGRIVLKTDCLTWLTESIRRTNVQIVDISPEISVLSNRLPGEMHGDPADRIIVATTRVIDGILLTRDAKVLDYGKQGYVNTLAI